DQFGQFQNSQTCNCFKDFSFAKCHFNELQIILNARLVVALLRRNSRRENCLCSFLLIAYGCEAAYELGRNFVERTHKLRDRGLHSAKQLRQQFLTRRRSGQSLDAFLGQDVVGQCPTLDHQLVVGFCESCQYLGSLYGVGADAIDQRTGQLCGQLLERSADNSATHQRILQNTQIHARLTRSLAQYGSGGDVQTTILGDNDRLSLCQLGSDFLDDYRFLFTIETHGLNSPKTTPGKSLASTECGAPGRVLLGQQEFFHGRRLRWTRKYLLRN